MSERARRLVALLLAGTVCAIAVAGVFVAGLSLLGHHVLAHRPTPSAAAVVDPAVDPAADPTPSGARSPDAGTPAPPAAQPVPDPPPPPPPPPPARVRRTVDAPGGSTVAACQAGDAYLVSWTPAPGFGVNDVRRGPTDIARVRFESGDTRVTVEVWCAGGVPQAEIKQDGHGDDAALGVH
jgi:hypothetical protein